MGSEDIEKIDFLLQTCLIVMITCQSVLWTWTSLPLDPSFVLGGPDYHDSRVEKWGHARPITDSLFAAVHVSINLTLMTCQCVGGADYSILRM